LQSDTGVGVPLPPQLRPILSTQQPPLPAFQPLSQPQVDKSISPPFKQSSGFSQDSSGIQTNSGITNTVNEDQLKQIKQISFLNRQPRHNFPANKPKVVYKNTSSAALNDALHPSYLNLSPEPVREDQEEHKERGQSAPAKFDQSMHNHFGIDNDFYTKQFTQGNIQERMDPQYFEFFRL
jgi:hypothetical protein